MSYARDPLSARYDASASRVVDRAIAAGGWIEVAVPAPTDKARAWAARRGIALGARSDPATGVEKSGQPANELAYEAAFRRACYYEDRVYLWDKDGGRDMLTRRRLRNPARTHSLAFKWTQRRTRGGRIARVLALPAGAGSRTAKTRGWT